VDAEAPARRRRTGCGRRPCASGPRARLELACRRRRATPVLARPRSVRGRAAPGRRHRGGGRRAGRRPGRRDGRVRRSRAVQRPLPDDRHGRRLCRHADPPRLAGSRPGRLRRGGRQGRHGRALRRPGGGGAVRPSRRARRRRRAGLPRPAPLPARTGARPRSGSCTRCDCGRGVCLHPRCVHSARGSLAGDDDGGGRVRLGSRSSAARGRRVRPSARGDLRGCPGGQRRGRAPDEPGGTGQRADRSRLWAIADRRCDAVHRVGPDAQRSRSLVPRSLPCNRDRGDGRLRGGVDLAGSGRSATARRARAVRPLGTRPGCACRRVRDGRRSGGLAPAGVARRPRARARVERCGGAAAPRRGRGGAGRAGGPRRAPRRRRAGTEHRRGRRRARAPRARPEHPVTPAARQARRASEVVAAGRLSRLPRRPSRGVAARARRSARAARGCTGAAGVAPPAQGTRGRAPYNRRR